MPSLGDYIGRLVAEAANARAQADLETARLAESYRAHPMLRYFPVPHFRLPTVKLSVPVAVVDLPAQKGSQPSVSQAEEAVGGAIRQVLTSHGVAVTEAEWSGVIAKLGEAAKRLEAEPASHETDLDLADALSRAASEALSKRLGEADPEKPARLPPGGTLLTALRDGARLAVIALRVPPAGLEVNVTARELAGIDPNTVIHVELTLNEQGLEWSGGDDEPDRLTPE